LQGLLDAVRWAQMNDDAKANKDTEANNDELWMDEEFRRLYPLSAQRLRDLAVQQREDSEYRKYVDTLRSLQASAGELSAKEGLDLEFRPKDPQEKDHQVQGGSAWADHQEDGE
jgi:methionine salvage enolase-phosphatase E1